MPTLQHLPVPASSGKSFECAVHEVDLAHSADSRVIEGQPRSTPTYKLLYLLLSTHSVLLVVHEGLQR